MMSEVLSARHDSGAKLGHRAPHLDNFSALIKAFGGDSKLTGFLLLFVISFLAGASYFLGPHVLNRGGRGVQSPLDRFRKAVS